MEWITPSILDGIGTVGTWTLIVLLLVFDKGLALKSSVTFRDKIIERQWQIIDEKDAQLNGFKTATQISAGALEKISNAADDLRSN